MLSWPAKAKVRCNPQKKNQWKRWRVEAYSSQSHAARQPERRIDLRKVFGGQSRLETAASRCAGGRYREASRCIGKKRSRQHARSQRDRNHPPLHAPLYVELCYRPRNVPARFVHDEIQPESERSGGKGRGPRERASLPTGEDFARCSTDSENAERVPD